MHPNTTETHVFLGEFDFGDEPRAAVHTHSRWVLRPDLPKTAPLEAQIDSLLCLLEERADRVRRTVAEFTATIWVAVHTSDPNPGTTVSADAGAGARGHRRLKHA